jgi:hypothetical protein
MRISFEPTQKVKRPRVPPVAAIAIIRAKSSVVPPPPTAFTLNLIRS